MNRMSTFKTSTMTLLCVGAVVYAAPAVAQQKSLTDQLVGTWTLAELYIEYQDGRRATTPFGGDQKGMAMFAPDGHFSYVIMGGARKKFAVNNRNEGTAEENKAAVLGSIAYYGTYTVDEADKSLTYNIDRSSFPNWDGTARKASVTISGDEFQQVSAPIPSSGGTYVPHLVWKRAQPTSAATVGAGSMSPGK